MVPNEIKKYISVEIFVALCDLPLAKENGGSVALYQALFLTPEDQGN